MKTGQQARVVVWYGDVTPQEMSLQPQSRPVCPTTVEGLLTDYLVRKAGATVVVRYNGGAQAGHNVVTPGGRHHTFSQLGAGSFVAGVRTYLSRYVVVHPTALLREAEALRGKGAGDVLARLRISAGALLISPFHQALGRLRELARGEDRHGSCGVGVGEAVQDALARPDEAIVAGDLRDPAALLRKLWRVRERKRAEAFALAGAAPTGGGAGGAGAVQEGGAGRRGAAARERGAPAAREDRMAREVTVFSDPGVIDRWAAAACSLARSGVVAGDELLASWLATAPATVFEGAQGVLLDEWAGFHPYTTWSRCTLQRAEEILAEAAPDALVQRIGVLRTHAVRHGPGPLPTETAELRAAVRDHNRDGQWQGPVRYGWFDAVLARYALEVTGPLDLLALTHLDVPARLGRWRLCAAYRCEKVNHDDRDLALFEPAGLLQRLLAPGGRCLERQARLTALLSAVRPVLADCDPQEPSVIAETERLLGRSIDLISRGPSAADVAPVSLRLGDRGEALPPSSPAAWRAASEVGHRTW